MEKQIDHWHKAAELFLQKQLTLPEIGKLMIINQAIGLIEGDEEAVRVGVNVLDNSLFHDALVFGLLLKQPPEKPISYPEIASLLSVSTRVVGLSVERLINKGAVEKEDRGRLGAVYTIHTDEFERIPPWVAEFTAALANLHNDPELKAATTEAVSRTQFSKGFQVLVDEVRNKFYRPRKAPQS